MNDLGSVGNGYIPAEERASVKSSLMDVKFRSGLRIFQDHCGFIDGEIHTFIGTKGSGKSTWSKTILSEILYEGKSALLYISEEAKSKYLSSLNNDFLLAGKKEEELKGLMENLLVLSEIDAGYDNEAKTLSLIKEVIEHANIDLFIFDNFTTSFMAELNINTQSAILRSFKNLAKICNIPVILFFHTGKMYDTKRLDGDNVRGSGTAVNIGSYNYLIAQHNDGTKLRNFVYTEKARYHSLANKRMYEMEYNPKFGVFTGCKLSSMKEFQDLMGGKTTKREV